LARFKDARVEAKFAGYTPEAGEKILILRALVFEVAASLPEVGEIEETLRWNEPAYLTSQTGSGSLIRIDAKMKHPGTVSVYFHCQTNLIAQFESLFAGQMAFFDNREIRFAADESLPIEALRVCFAAALTYHFRK
jgi:hypothetical protein